MYLGFFRNDLCSLLCMPIVFSHCTMFSLSLFVFFIKSPFAFVSKPVKGLPKSFTDIISKDTALLLQDS